MQLIINIEDMRWGDLRAFVAAGAANADDEEVIFERDKRGDVSGIWAYVIDEQVTPPPAWWVESWRKAEKQDEKSDEPGTGDLLDAVTDAGSLVEGLRKQLKE